jgi:signal transduction histidine kinase
MHRPQITLRTRMSLLYGALICTSVIAVLGVVYLVAPGLLQHRAWQGAPGKGLSASQLSGHSSGVLSSFISSDSFRAAVVAVVIMAVFSLALGWLIAGRFVRPLQAIISTARDISASNLHRRLGLDGQGDEFGELGETLDDLFARLEASFDSQRHFIANASHELRTPLSAGRALLQVAIADPEPSVQALRETCQELVELTDQQERLIAALLTLADSQRGLERPEPVDLADVTRQVVLERSDDAGRRGVRLTAALGAAPVAGDPNLAASLIANLVDNAVRHNLPGGQAEITTTLTSAGATVTVSNSGPHIPAHAVEELFQPFRQLGAERIRHGEGHGLGLAIVRAIADAHGAAVSASPRSEGGLDITVTFP